MTAQDKARRELWAYCARFDHGPNLEAATLARLVADAPGSGNLSCWQWWNVALLLAYHIRSLEKKETA